MLLLISVYSSGSLMQYFLPGKVVNKEKGGQCLQQQPVKCPVKRMPGPTQVCISKTGSCSGHWLQIWLLFIWEPLTLNFHQL